MKKGIIYSLLLLIVFVQNSYAQNYEVTDDVYTRQDEPRAAKKGKMTEYAASNNVIYHIGDTITLGRGSTDRGQFIYCQMGGAYDALNVIGGTGTTQSGLPKQLAGSNMIIKSIKQQKMKGAMRTYFNVAGGNIVQYRIWIEDALETGEVISTGLTSDQALEQLKKAKDKYDLELITKEEYEAEKQKLKQFIK